VQVEVPHGEVADRISILRLKVDRIADPAALAHVLDHLARLEAAWTDAGLPPLDGAPGWPELCEVNARLWDVEDALRACERAGRFDEEFVALARSVYRLNDRRAALKRALDVALGSPLVEEKSYGD